MYQTLAALRQAGCTRTSTPPSPIITLISENIHSNTAYDGQPEDCLVSSYSTGVYILLSYAQSATVYSSTRADDSCCICPEGIKYDDSHVTAVVGPIITLVDVLGILLVLDSLIYARRRSYVY